eukprot:15481510-Alexandrium_andersonii.AAC.1
MMLIRWSRSIASADLPTPPQHESVNLLSWADDVVSPGRLAAAVAQEGQVSSRSAKRAPTD